MGNIYTIKAGDTLSEIGAAHGLDWRRIWDLAANRNVGWKVVNGQSVRDPRHIQPGQTLEIPEKDVLKRSDVQPNQTAICTLREQVLESAVPRFDCHCHVHADSVFRMYALACRSPSEAQKAMLCHSEHANFDTLTWPEPMLGRVAVAPLLLDLAYCPLWHSPLMESPLEVGKIATYSRTAQRTTKNSRSLTEWDPLNLYPAGEYVVIEDGMDRWRDVIEAIHRNNPGYCFPFFPFDPRRPFAFIRATDAIEHHGFVGIKLYSRTGWRFNQNEAMAGDSSRGQFLDQQVRQMLEWAGDNGVPVVNHGSPGGWPPDEHIAFPRGFDRLHESEQDLTRYEQAWIKEHSHHWRGIGAFGPTAAGFVRRAVVGFLRAGGRVNTANVTAMIRQLLNTPDCRPIVMTDSDFHHWVQAASGFAVEFERALHRYKQLTVEPELSVLPANLRLCLAHCGGETILADQFQGKLGYESMVGYSNQHRSQSWLNTEAISRFLTRPNSFVDLAYFSGVHDDPNTPNDPGRNRRLVYVEILKWLATRNFTDKVLFGTDWPLTWVMDDLHVGNVWRTVWTAAESEDVRNIWPNCWNEITKINPMRFLGLTCDSPTVERLKRFLGMERWGRSWLAAEGLSLGAERTKESQRPLTHLIDVFAEQSQQVTVRTASTQSRPVTLLSENPKEQESWRDRGEGAARLTVSIEAPSSLGVFVQDVSEDAAWSGFVSMVVQAFSQSDIDFAPREMFAHRQLLLLNFFGISPDDLGPETALALAEALDQFELAGRSESGNTEPPAGMPPYQLNVSRHSQAAVEVSTYRFSSRSGELQLETQWDRRLKRLTTRLAFQGAKGVRAKSTLSYSTDASLEVPVIASTDPLGDYLSHDPADASGDGLEDLDGQDQPDEAPEGVGSFFEGALAGDFSENTSWSATAGQVTVGFVPIAGQVADARDILAAGGDVLDGQEGSWGRLAIAVVCVIPGLDFLKGGSKAGRKALRNTSEESLTGTSKASFKRLKSRISKAGLARAKALFKALAVTRKESIERLNRLLNDAALHKRLSSNVTLKTKWLPQIRKTRNTIQDHLKGTDLSGAFRDVHGLPVKKGTSSLEYKHLAEELPSARRNVQQSVKMMSAWLANNLHLGRTADYKLISETADMLKEYDRMIGEFLSVK